jgi:hypothetical protein
MCGTIGYLARVSPNSNGGCYLPLFLTGAGFRNLTASQLTALCYEPEGRGLETR